MPLKPRNSLLPALLALLIAILASAVSYAAPLASFDLTILGRIHTHATPGLTLLAKGFSLIGSPRIIWPATILLAAILFFRHHRRAALTLLTTMAASGLLETLIKLAVRRSRPAVPWAYVAVKTYSFPSGHATLAAALYGLLALYALRRQTQERAALLTLSLIMILGIGLSRLYLGAHHPTDVLAGYLTGALCVFALQNRPPG